MVRLTCFVGALLACAGGFASFGTGGADSAAASATISAGVTGPSAADYNTIVGFTLTITNSGEATAHNVAFSVGFPDNPALESNEDVICPVSTAGDGMGHLVGTIGDLAAGASVSCTFNVHINAAGVLRHPWTVTSSDAGGASGEYDLTGNPPPPPPPPPPPTTITFSLSDPVKSQGLTGTQVATVVNTGSNPALSLHVGVIVDYGIEITGESHNVGTCTYPNPRVINCDVSSLPVGATFTVRITVRLPVFLDAASSDDAEATLANGDAVQTGAISYFHDRYWPCICQYMTFPNGWTVPGVGTNGVGGYSVDGDDTVHLNDGYLIEPDGAVRFPDGRRIVFDTAGIPTFLLPTQSPPAPASTTPVSTAAPPTTIQPSSPAAAPAAPALVQACRIAGSPVVGQLLRPVRANFNRAPSGVVFAWQMRATSGRWKSFSHATRLRIGPSLVGKQIRVVETARFATGRLTVISRAVRIRRT